MVSFVFIGFVTTRIPGDTNILQKIFTSIVRSYYRALFCMRDDFVFFMLFKFIHNFNQISELRDIEQRFNYNYGTGDLLLNLLRDFPSINNKQPHDVAYSLSS